VIADELNVKEILTSADEGELVLLSAKANFRKLGPELGADMRDVAAAIAALDAGTLEDVLRGGTANVAGREFGEDDMIIERTARDETIVETGTDMAVALDTHISDDLLLEGIARELISRVQRMRREAGLDVTDRVAFSWWSEDPEVRAAIATHSDQIASEVLAATMKEADRPLDDPIQIDERSVGLQITAR
jgi:isoleucyl-tRNA synthetase